MKKLKFPIRLNFKKLHVDSKKLRLFLLILLGIVVFLGIVAKLYQNYLNKKRIDIIEEEPSKKLSSSLEDSILWTYSPHISSMNDIIFNNNELWIACKGGLIYWNIQDGTKKIYNSSVGLRNNDIKTLTLVEDFLYMGSDGGLSRLNIKTDEMEYFSEKDSNVSADEFDLFSNEPISTIAGNLHRTRNKGRIDLPFFRPYGIIDSEKEKDAPNVIWLGSSQGIYRYDTKSDIWKGFNEVNNTRVGKVYSIFTTSSDLWAIFKYEYSERIGGILRYHFKERKWTIYDEESGFQTELLSLNRLVGDDNNILAFSNQAIFKYNNVSDEWDKISNKENAEYYDFNYLSFNQPFLWFTRKNSDKTDLVRIDLRNNHEEIIEPDIEGQRGVKDGYQRGDEIFFIKRDGFLPYNTQDRKWGELLKFEPEWTVIDIKAFSQNQVLFEDLDNLIIFDAKQNSWNPLDISKDILKNSEILAITEEDGSLKDIWFTETKGWMDEKPKGESFFGLYRFQIKGEKMSEIKVPEDAPAPFSLENFGDHLLWGEGWDGFWQYDMDKNSWEIYKDEKEWLRKISGSYQNAFGVDIFVDGDKVWRIKRAEKKLFVFEKGDDKITEINYPKIADKGEIAKGQINFNNILDKQDNQVIISISGLGIWGCNDDNFEWIDKNFEFGGSDELSYALKMKNEIWLINIKGFVSEGKVILYNEENNNREIIYISKISSQFPEKIAVTDKLVWVLTEAGIWRYQKK